MCSKYEYFGAFGGRIQTCVFEIRTFRRHRCLPMKQKSAPIGRTKEHVRAEGKAERGLACSGARAAGYKARALVQAGCTRSPGCWSAASAVTWSGIMLQRTRGMPLICRDTGLYTALHNYTRTTLTRPLPNYRSLFWQGLGSQGLVYKGLVYLGQNVTVKHVYFTRVTSTMS